ncbi:MAG: hypothetical protein KatS3mg014_2457 [Actinomycetota bacterium]|nr:MAG: hypothetical protein KatS3mg014_2457 [Actinomycetota bacterium]
MIVGSAQVRIQPDLGGFAEALRAAGRRIPPVQVRFALDSRSLQQAVRAQAQTIAKIGAGVKLPVAVEVRGAHQVEALRQGLREIRGFRGTVNVSGLEDASRGLGKVGANASAASEATRRLLQEIRNLLVVTAGIEVIGRPLAQFVGAGLAAAANLEQARVAMESLTGSSREAAELIADLQSLAKRTPFAFQDFLGAAQQLLAIGQNGQQVVETLEAVATAAAASGAVTKDTLDRSVLAITQIASSGKLLGQDLRQIFQSLPAVGRTRVFDELAKSIGTTREQVQAMQEEGLIPSALALEAILNAMRNIPGAAEALQRQATTLAGTFERLKESVQFALADAFAPFAERAAGFLDRALPAVQESVKRLAAIFAEGVGRALPSLVSALPSLEAALEPLLRAFLNLAPALAGGAAAVATLADAFKPVAALIASIPAPVLQFAGAVLVARAAIASLLPAIARFASSIVGLVTLRQVAAAVQAIGTTAETVAPNIAASGSALAGLAGLGAGASAALGAVGLALTAATVGATIFAARTQEAKRRAEEHQRVVQDLVNKLRQLGDEGEDVAAGFERLAAEQIKLADPDILHAIALTGLSFRDIGRVMIETGGRGEAFERVVNRIGFAFDGLQSEAVAKAFEKLAKAFQEAGKAALDQMVAEGQLSRQSRQFVEDLNRAADGTVNYARAAEMAQTFVKDLESATGPLTDGMSSVEAAQLRAAAAAEQLQDAMKGVKETFDATAGRSLDAARASLDLSQAQNRLADLQKELTDELEGTEEEHKRVERAERSLKEAQDALAESNQRVADATERNQKAQKALADAIATESERAQRKLIEAQADLERSHLRIIELEQQRVDLADQLQKAQDPRRIQQLANLERLRASVGAAPPSFLEKLDDEIERLRREVGPRAVERIQREQALLELELGQARLDVEKATRDIAQAEKERVEGTKELKDAIEAARNAERDLEDAKKASARATQAVKDAEDDLADARKKLEPDQKRVRDLELQIRDAQLQVVDSALKMAVAVGSAASRSGDELRRNVVDALDRILQQFPAIRQMFDQATADINMTFDVRLAISNLEEFIDGIRRAVDEATRPRQIPRNVRQHGGPVRAGNPVLVGEAGPELFVPVLSGTVLSAGETRALLAARREAARPNQITVLAPSTDAREIVDGVLRGLRALQFLGG